MTATVGLLSRLWACCVSWWRHLVADSQIGVLAVLDQPPITKTQGAQVNPRIINKCGLGSRIDWVTVVDTSTEDAQAWVDVMGLRALAGAVTGAIKRRPDGREIADRFLRSGAVEYGIDKQYSHCPTHDFSGGMCTFSCPERRRIDIDGPWPVDEAEVMLAAWRSQGISA
jgi:hypothetical protein